MAGGGFDTASSARAPMAREGFETASQVYRVCGVLLAAKEKHRVKHAVLAGSHFVIAKIPPTPFRRNMVQAPHSPILSVFISRIYFLELTDV